MGTQQWLHGRLTSTSLRSCPNRTLFPLYCVFTHASEGTPTPGVTWVSQIHNLPATYMLVCAYCIMGVDVMNAR